MKSSKLFTLLSAALFASLSTSCSSGTSADDAFDASDVCPESLRGTFTDARDNQEYKYTTIGSQVWMADNMNYDDGSSPCADTACDAKGRTYGMYQALNVCPGGWHLPSDAEWQILFESMGGIDSAGYRLKATEGWIPLNPGWQSNGTDDCGFALKPIPASGIYTNGNGGRKTDGYVALLWTSSTNTANNYSMDGVVFQTQESKAQITLYYSMDHMSVRCVKD